MDLRAIFAAVLIVTASPFGVTWAEQDDVTVAVVTDGVPEGDFERLQQIFTSELVRLAQTEFSIEYLPFAGGWTADGIRAALNDAYENPDVDMVLVLGIAANQMLVSHPSFEKPTFMPLVFDADLLGAPPPKAGGSGKSNLNYLSDSLQFRDDLQALRRVYPFTRVAFVVDEIVLKSVGDVVTRARENAAELGVTLKFVVHAGQSALWEQIPADVDAVLVTGLPRMPAAEFDVMLDRFTQRGLPSFSLVGGQSSVARGFLASDAADQDWTRLARRNALNMQAVMLGEAASDQPVTFEGKRQLTINMEVARSIGLSPRFDVLTEAVLLNEEPIPSGEIYSLQGVAERAVEANLDLLAERASVAAGFSDVRDANAQWLPQLDLGASYTQRNVSPLVSAGQIAERSSDASVTFSQVLYADGAAANRTIQRQVQISREQALEQLRLDIVQDTTLAFLNVLRTQTQLRIRQDNLNLTRTNLELARDRVRVGSSSAADLYRWQTRMADARSQVLSARASLDQSQVALNRILNQPQDAAFQIVEPKVDDPFAFAEAEFNALVDNPAKYRALTDYFVERGLERSPELQQLDALRAAKDRELTSRRRSVWLPDFAIQGQYSDNFGQSGVGAGPQENMDDWSIMVVGTIPLFTGGQRRSAIARADHERSELDARIASLSDKIEQSIRTNMLAVNASYPAIRLSREAAVASRQNLELVTDAYAKGVVSVIDLLDAQNAALQAEESAANAVYNFLIDVMQAQRSTGAFDMLMEREEQRAEARRILQYINQSDSRSNASRGTP